jgi:6 kDa early secretory antigenic target
MVAAAGGYSTDGFYANIPTMQQAIEDLEGSSQRLQGYLDQLQENLQPLISSWSGAAQECYVQCQRQWDAACQDMQTLLQRAGTTVGQASTLYSNTDGKVASAWSGMS